MAPEEELKKQAEEQEKKAKETIDNSLRIPLTDKQAGILRKITLDKKRLEEEFAKLGEKENDLITFMLEFKDIKQKDVQELKLSELGDALVVVMKPVAKKDEPKVDEKKPTMQVNGENNVIGNHNTQNVGIQKEGGLKLDKLKPHQPPKLVGDKPVA